MFTLNDLTEEIKARVSHLISRGISCHPDFVTREIMGDHQDIEGEDADFFICTARITIREQVRRQINRFKLDEKNALDPDPQLVLPGFQRLQRAYLIPVGEEQVAVPLEKIPSALRQVKIAELRAMGDGCYQHADELERFDRQYPLAA